MWFNTKTRDVEALGSSCCLCGVSRGQKFVTRQEQVGCISSPYTFCKPCLARTDSERKEREYKTSHFCNKCDRKIVRPYRKNRKSLNFQAGYQWYSLNLCPKCYNIEIARIPKYQEDEDLWSNDSVCDDKGLW